MSYLPPLPPGYDYSLAKRQNLLLGFSPTLPILYLDEATMTWRELDRHVSEVHPALASST
jgi:hypothetical protein